MLRKNVEKRQMMKQLDQIFLAVDEICDRGIVLEIEPNDVVDKVSLLKIKTYSERCVKMCQRSEKKKTRTKLNFRLLFEMTTYHSLNRRSHKFSNQPKNRSSGPCSNNHLYI